MSQLTQPFSSRNAILAFIAPPLVPALPPPAGTWSGIAGASSAFATSLVLVALPPLTNAALEELYTDDRVL